MPTSMTMTPNSHPNALSWIAFLGYAMLVALLLATR